MYGNIKIKRTACGEGAQSFSVKNGKAIREIFAGIFFAKSFLRLVGNFLEADCKFFRTPNFSGKSFLSLAENF